MEVIPGIPVLLNPGYVGNIMILKLFLCVISHVTTVLVTALCNQPEAFASDLGDDQSRYLCKTVDVTL